MRLRWPWSPKPSPREEPASSEAGTPCAASSGPPAPPEPEAGVEAWWLASESIEVGKLVCVEAPPVPGRSGLHASRSILDALPYAKSTTLCRVRLSGRIVEVEGQLAATERVVLASLDAREPLRELIQKWIARSLSSAGVEAGTLDAHHEGAAKERARAIALEGEIRDAEWSIGEGAGRRSADARANAEGKIAGARRALAEARSRAFAHEAAVALADDGIRGLVQAIDLVTRSIAVAEGGDREEVLATVRRDLDAQAESELLGLLPPLAPLPPRSRPAHLRAPPTDEAAPRRAMPALTAPAGVVIESVGTLGPSLASTLDELCARSGPRTRAFALTLPPRLELPEGPLCPLLLSVDDAAHADRAVEAARALDLDVLVEWMELTGCAWRATGRLGRIDPEAARDAIEDAFRWPVRGTSVHELRFQLARSGRVRSAGWIEDPTAHPTRLLVAHVRRAEDAAPVVELVFASGFVPLVLWGEIATAAEAGRIAGPAYVLHRARNVDFQVQLFHAVVDAPEYTRHAGLAQPFAAQTHAHPPIAQPPGIEVVGLSEMLASIPGLERAHPLALTPGAHGREAAAVGGLLLVLRSAAEAKELALPATPLSLMITSADLEPYRLSERLAHLAPHRARSLLMASVALPPCWTASQAQLRLEGPAGLRILLSADPCVLRAGWVTPPDIFGPEKPILVVHASCPLYAGNVRDLERALPPGTAAWIAEDLDLRSGLREDRARRVGTLSRSIRLRRWSWDSLRDQLESALGNPIYVRPWD
ncbi:MAG: hypothetical protein IT378_24900 [Sandaracinaceae bacterium]|nr:hypothetical protein [Sandaracinaceae bacterium]